MSNISRKNIIPIALLFMTALLWGSGFPVRKMAMETVTPLFLNFLRFAIGFIFLLIFYTAINKGKLNPVRNNTPEVTYAGIKHQILGGVVMGILLSLSSAFQQTALLTTSSGNTAFLTSLYTIIVPIISALFLKHKIQLKTWICAVVAIVGIYLIGGTLYFSLELGDTLAIISAVCFATHVLAVGHYARKSDGIFLSTVQMLVASIANLIFSLILESGNSLEGVITAMLPLIYSGVMALGIPYTFQIIGQKNTKASVAAIVLSLESVFGALFGLLILHETMSLMQVGGCVLIFTAVIVTQINPKKTL
jgi:drug/metabolite transporter (DMT)-like permease